MSEFLANTPNYNTQRFFNYYYFEGSNNEFSPFATSYYPIIPFMRVITSTFFFITTSASISVVLTLVYPKQLHKHASSVVYKSEIY